MKLLGTFSQVSDLGLDAILSVMQDADGSLVLQMQIIRGVPGIMKIAAADAPEVLAAIGKLTPPQ